MTEAAPVDLIDGVLHTDTMVLPMSRGAGRRGRLIIKFIGVVQAKPQSNIHIGKPDRDGAALGCACPHGLGITVDDDRSALDRGPATTQPLKKAA
ncbi:hypothetical protein [Lichenifustis flavocetrariae]|uniref:Uncharacterized protein n=1 Tax=Lichenifustis flavocetrariae TaxID=2949735 RepID=A0AA42CMW0_9HYPH|nr:hypothetical protein [Lichenifustis flavocetrariae]MCW6512001.1 hypothetical protein [Lichenifustis flavocetrariae]